jgi:4-hydroxy-tetrahydrodipicolinate synthase
VASEVYKLSDEERRRIAQRVLAQAGRAVPVWVGSGHASTELAVDHSIHAERHGAAGLMVMPPYAMKPSLAGVAAYFKAIDRAVNIPIMIQDAPLVSGIHLPVDFMVGLAEKMPNVRYVKVEAPPTGPKTSEVLSKAGGTLTVFGGLGGGNFIDELHRGALGTLPGSAFPEVHVEILRRYRSGDTRGATTLHRQVQPLLRFVGQSVEFSFHAYKRILKRRGVIESAYVRQPSATFDDSAETELEELMGLIEHK